MSDIKQKIETILKAQMLEKDSYISVITELLARIENLEKSQKSRNCY